MRPWGFSWIREYGNPSWDEVFDAWRRTGLRSRLMQDTRKLAEKLNAEEAELHKRLSEFSGKSQKVSKQIEAIQFQLKARRHARGFLLGRIAQFEKEVGRLDIYHQRIFVAAFEAGFLFSMAVHGNEIVTGKVGNKVIQGGVKGASRRKGPTTDFQYSYREAYDRLKTKHPRLGHVKLTDMVGQEFGRTGRHIRSYVPNPDPTPRAKRRRKLENNP